MISNFPIQLPYILNVKKACSVLTSWVRWSGGILSFAKPSCSIITWCWVCMNINFYWQGKMCHLAVKVILAVSMVFILFWFTKKQKYFPGKKRVNGEVKGIPLSPGGIFFPYPTKTTIIYCEKMKHWILFFPKNLSPPQNKGTSYLNHN